MTLLNFSRMRVTGAALVILATTVGCDGGTENGNDAEVRGRETGTQSTNTQAQAAGPLDTLPLSELVPERNVDDLLWDYQDDLLDFHLEDRPGAVMGRAAHWNNPGDFAPGAMVRVFRYRDRSAAESSRDVGFVAPFVHEVDTMIADRRVRLTLDSTHLEDHSTIAAVNLEHVSGRTEVEIHATQTVEGIVHQLDDEWGEARQDAFALFDAIVRRKPTGGEEMESQKASPAAQARQQRREQYIDSLSASVSNRRTTTLLKLDSLGEYIPERIEGFKRVESYAAPQKELQAWGAQSGWLSFWEAPNLPPDVALHDLTVDLYRFEDIRQAEAAVYWDMQKTGRLQIEVVKGLPVVLVASDRPDGADVHLGYQQDGLALRISAMKDMIEGDASPQTLVSEVYRAFQAVINAAQED